VPDNILMEDDFYSTSIVNVKNTLNRPFSSEEIQKAVKLKKIKSGRDDSIINKYIKFTIE